MASEIENQNPSVDPHTTTFGRYKQPVIAGLIGTTLVSLAASLPGSPFAFKVPGAWFFGTPPPYPSQGIAHARGFALFAVLACGFIGVVLLCRSWQAIVRNVARQPLGETLSLKWILALWSAPLLVAPPMFSNDIYSYAAQGEMVSHHISPYLYGPGILGATPFASLANGVWINTPSLYGPLFSGLEGGIVNVAGHRALVSIVLLRLLAIAGVALIAAFLPLLAQSYGKDPGLAFALAVLNPLVLLFLVGSGHNDALMIGLLVAGLSIARRGHSGWGIVVCALAGAVKAPGLVGVFAIAWTSATGPRPMARRSLALVGAGVITAAIFAASSVSFGVGWEWIRSLGDSDRVKSWITPVDLVAKVLPHVGIPASRFVDVAHIVGPVLAAVVGLWALIHLPTLGLPRALGLTLLAFVLLGPIVQPWYLVWGIALLSVTAGPRTASVIISLSVSASLLGVVGLGRLIGEFNSLGLPYQALFSLTVAAAVVVPVTTAFPRVNAVTSRHLVRWRTSTLRQLQRA